MQLDLCFVNNTTYAHTLIAMVDIFLFYMYICKIFRRKKTTKDRWETKQVSICLQSTTAKCCKQSFCVFSSELITIIACKTYNIKANDRKKNIYRRRKDFRQRTAVDI